MRQPRFNPSPGLNVFQTADIPAVSRCAASFNPSPGLNVFQTRPTVVLLDEWDKFQSLTWVERLSDLPQRRNVVGGERVSIPHLG